jgi:uracil phosphoribosyltransferase
VCVISLRMCANDLMFLCADETTQQTPVGPFTGTSIKPKVGLTPILRAGLGMTDALLSLFPYATGYTTLLHLLTYR